MRTPEYGSDFVADVIGACGFEFVSLNPGASFRGLHDSIVNYRDNDPVLIQCLHEQIAVGLAHGYARATGRATAVILHDVVGLLHGSMAIYYAYLDRVPVVVFGGAGPMASNLRRPDIDWIHTANVQGNAVREFTKWDDQPGSVEAVGPSVARAVQIARAEPRGPVYIAIDAQLQEQRLPAPPRMPDPARLPPPSPIAPEAAALDRLATLLVTARRPVLVAGYVGRDEANVAALVALAETVGAGVLDTHRRLSFPNRHPQNVEGTGALGQADLVVLLDLKDTQKVLTRSHDLLRTLEPAVAPDATVVDVGFADIGISSWTQDFGALDEVDLRITADVSVALPLLVQRCRALVDAQPDEARRARAERVGELGRERGRISDGWAAQAAARADDRPVATSRLAAEVWAAVREHDWVLAAGTANDWVYRLWDFDRPYRHTGRSLGTGTQISMALGVALAHKGSGRLVVDLQPDGDLLYAPGALWTAAYHEIPLLVVMYNNRSYYNDQDHQYRIAEDRRRPTGNAHIGMELSNPAPDFATLARSLGWHAEGPVEDPSALAGALRRAVEVVTREGRPALVDVVCQAR